MPVPTVEAHAAFLAPVTRHTRRLDIYEEDASTPWLMNAKFTEGNVTVDYSRAERRAVDTTLDNNDGEVTYAPDKFWYDKIIKSYRGVEYFEDEVTQTEVAENLITNPSVVGLTGYNPVMIFGMVQSPDGGTGGPGSSSVRLKTAGNIDSYVEVQGSAGIPANMIPGQTYTFSAAGKLPLAWAGNQHTTRARRVVVTVTAASLGGTVAYASDPVEYTGGLGSWKRVKVTFHIPLDTTQVSLRAYLGTVGVDADVIDWDDFMLTTDATLPYFDGSRYNGRWTGTANASTSKLILDIHNKTFKTWETQIGEFMIDSLKESNFPDTVHVTGRDYAKKMLASKFVVATGFTATDSLESVISSIAANAGIPANKRLIPATGLTLGRSFIFERGVNRWDACKQLSEAHGYELFFNAQGMLVMRQFLDPSTSPLSYTFETGDFGSLVTYDKTVSDSQLYNHVVVAGEATDTIPVWAEARNDNPASPTNIAAIGDRYTEYISSFITTTAQAQDVANQFLAIYSLQEYDLNFSSLMLPWMEVGEIIEFIDPKAAETQPDRFLLSQLNIPLSLGPMTGIGKRVTILG